jgi:hypothetical protein
MERIQIQFTEEQARRVRRAAAERSLSVAAVVREALEAHLAEPGAAARAKALGSLGGYRSGRTDVAARHDEYLAEDFR